MAIGTYARNVKFPAGVVFQFYKAPLMDFAVCFLVPKECSSEGGEPQSEAIYEVGTLSYTRSSLGVLFAWLLWGDLMSRS